MPLVRPDYTKMPIDKQGLVAGRYVLRIIEATESSKLDKNGHNALVVKFQVVNNKEPGYNGQKVSRWLTLGGPGSVFLFRFMKCVDSAYAGGPFSTESFVGKTIEADVVIEKNLETGKDWAKVDRMYPYLSPGDVAATLRGNVQEEDIPDFDDFDK